MDAGGFSPGANNKAWSILEYALSLGAPETTEWGENLLDKALQLCSAGDKIAARDVLVQHAQHVQSTKSINDARQGARLNENAVGNLTTGASRS